MSNTLFWRNSSIFSAKNIRKKWMVWIGNLMDARNSCINWEIPHRRIDRCWRLIGITIRRRRLFSEIKSINFNSETKNWLIPSKNLPLNVKNWHRIFSMPRLFWIKNIKIANNIRIWRRRWTSMLWKPKLSLNRETIKSTRRITNRLAIKVTTTKNYDSRSLPSSSRYPSSKAKTRPISNRSSWTSEPPKPSESCLMRKTQP